MLPQGKAAQGPGRTTADWVTAQGQTQRVKTFTRQQTKNLWGRGIREEARHLLRYSPQVLMVGGNLRGMAGSGISSPRTPLRLLGPPAKTLCFHSTGVSFTPSTSHTVLDSLTSAFHQAKCFWRSGTGPPFHSQDRHTAPGRCSAHVC